MISLASAPAKMDDRYAEVQDMLIEDKPKLTFISVNI
jgi:hypothetical protein